MSILVKDLMIPVEQYPSVNKEASLAEAAARLREAHNSLEGKSYQPRAVLVTDDQGRIVGKLSLWDALKALEPKYEQIQDFERLSHWGIDPDFVRKTVDDYKLWNDPLESLCQRAAGLHVADFYRVPGPNEYIDGGAGLAEAIHKLLMGKHLSLLVTSQDKIVGLLRLCDAFELVAGKIESCQI